MFTLADILCTTMVPFGAAVLVAVLISRWKKAQLLAPGFAVAGGFWAGKFATDFRDAWAPLQTQLSATSRILSAGGRALLHQLRPAEAHDWLALLGLMTALVSGLAIATNRRFWFWLGGLTMALVIPLRMLWSSVYFVSEWGALELVLRMAGIVGCLALPLFLVPRWSTEASRPSLVLMPILVAMGLLAAGLTFMLTGSKTYGELGSVLAFAFLGAWCGGLLSGTPLGYDDLPVVSMLLGGMAVLACAFSSTPVWQVLVLGVGVIMACRLLPAGAEATRWRQIGAFIILMASLGSVVGVAAWRFAEATRTDNPYSQYMK